MPSHLQMELQAKAFISSMPFPVHVQWTNGPAVLELLTAQEQKNGHDFALNNSDWKSF